MEKFDFLIVGLGLSGISFCEQLEARQHTFLVYEKGTDASASTVAGGLYNPVVLKKFTPSGMQPDKRRQPKPSMNIWNKS